MRPSSGCRPRFRVILIIGVLAFLGFTGLGIALFFTHERIDPIILMFSIAVCGFFGVVTLQALRRSRDQVAVDDNGMWYLPRVVAPTFIGWEPKSARCCRTESREAASVITGSTTGHAYASRVRIST